MATVAVQQIDIDGLAASYAAASGGGDKFNPQGDDVVLHVKNGGVGSINVTVVTPGAVVGQAIADLVVAVPATSEKFIGPFPGKHFRGDDGLAAITWSGTTSVTFAALRV